MNKKEFKIILEDNRSNFFYKKNKSNLKITFNRVAFIFFVFFLISLIYSIHLLHLGSRKSKSSSNFNIVEPISKLYRADIIDIDGNYIGKTINSIDIGISPSKIINQKNNLIVQSVLV